MTTPQLSPDYVRTRWGNNAPANADPFLVSKIQRQMQIALVSGQSGDTCAAFSKAGAGQVAEKLPKLRQTGPCQARLRWHGRADARDVQNAKTALQGMSVSDLTNGLTAAFCPIVEKRQGMSTLTKRNMLDQFAQLAYTQLSGGNIARGAKAGPQPGPVTR